MIRYKETYEIVTPDSASKADAEERGLVSENATATFREMVDLLEGTTPSCDPLPDRPGANVWYSTPPYMVDFETGAEETHSYHPASARDARYMAKAWRRANLHLPSFGPGSEPGASPR